MSVVLTAVRLLLFDCSCSSLGPTCWPCCQAATKAGKALNGVFLGSRDLLSYGLAGFVAQAVPPPGISLADLAFQSADSGLVEAEHFPRLQAVYFVWVMVGFHSLEELAWVPPLGFSWTDATSW